MNILLALGIMTGVYMREFPKQESVHSPDIGEVMPGSPAATAGLQAGDRIVDIAGVKDPVWQDIQAKEALNAGHPLPVAVTRDGKRLVTDGPFAETREQLGGYFLIDARNLDEAIDIAGQIPAGRYGTVEIRPVVEVPSLPAI